jgi:RecB family exonuclease
VNAARWDTLSRQAGVVQGAGQWTERLGGFHAGIDADLRRVRIEGDESEWQAQRLERDRADVAALQAFVADLAARLAPPERPTWATLATWARDLHDHYLGGEGHRADWPEPELVGARRVEEALAELGGLDAFDDRADLARFRRALAAELDAPVGRVGRFGTGVLVGQLGQGYAADFEVVYVLGGAEGTLPPRGREDPLLPDRDRIGAPNLALHADRRIEERRDYLAALASATERVATFPRADPRAQRKRLPAGWVVESARVLGRHDITAEQLRDENDQTWLEVVPSFAHLVTNGEPGSETEYALRSLSRARAAHRDLAQHPLAAGTLARGFVAAANRSSSRATPFDGFVGARPDLAPGASRPTSPTALQDWAQCPFRYFLSRVLRLRAIPRPEATESLSPLERGGLMHSILEEFVRDSPAPATPDTPWTREDAVRMARIVDRHCDDAEARGITGREVTWELERRHLLEDALHFLEVDHAVRADHGVLPAPDGLERAFGDDGRPAVDVEVAGGRTVRFRGRIDRVDRSPDGRSVVVYDYKTGSARYGDLVDDPVGAGRYLQLPVYALAAIGREGAERATALYWFTGEHGDTPFVGVDLDEARDRFVDVVGTIAAGVEGGCFPAVPGERTFDPRAQRETFESCRYCDFDKLCPVDRGTMAERKTDDPANLPFRSLRLPEAGPDETPDEMPDEMGPEHAPSRGGGA